MTSQLTLLARALSFWKWFVLFSGSLQFLILGSYPLTFERCLIYWKKKFLELKELIKIVSSASNMNKIVIPYEPRNRLIESSYRWLSTKWAFYPYIC